MATQVKRGTVLKVPGDTPGLLFVDGKQMPFRLEAMWNSAVAPAPNMTVEVTLDEAGALVGITAVDTQQLAREKLDKLAGIAGEQGQQAANVAKNGLAAQVARMGYRLLITMTVLWIAWFFLPALVVNSPFGGGTVKSFSFSQLTGIAIDGQFGVDSSFTFWSFIGLLCILAPWIAPWLKQRWAPLLHIAPLAFVILTYVRFKWAIHTAISNAISQAGGMAGALGGDQASAMAQRAAQSMTNEISDLLSTSWGLWIILIVSVIVAAMGFKLWSQRRKPEAALAG